MAARRQQVHAWYPTRGHTHTLCLSHTVFITLHAAAARCACTSSPSARSAARRSSAISSSRRTGTEPWPPPEQTGCRYAHMSMTYEEERVRMACHSGQSKPSHVTVIRCGRSRRAAGTDTVRVGLERGYMHHIMHVVETYLRLSMSYTWRPPYAVMSYT